jgi:hypothetical protein
MKIKSLPLQLALACGLLLTAGILTGARAANDPPPGEKAPASFTNITRGNVRVLTLSYSTGSGNNTTTIGPGEAIDVTSISLMGDPFDLNFTGARLSLRLGGQEVFNSSLSAGILFFAFPTPIRLQSGDTVVITPTGSGDATGYRVTLTGTTPDAAKQAVVVY